MKNFLNESKFRLAKRLTITFSFVFTLLTIAHINEPSGSFLVMLFGLTLSLLLLTYTLYSKKFLPVFYAYSFFGVFITGTGLILLPNATHYSDCIWMFSATILGFFGINRIVGYFLLGCTSLSIILFCIFSVNTNIAVLTIRTDFQKLSLACELIAAILGGAYIIILVMNFYKMTEESLMLANAELRENNQQIKAQDEEKTVLVKEIHHRVKNNLQIVTSLLRMQSSELKSVESKEQFQEAINRVMSMSLIHQKLYQGESLARVNLKQYIEELTNELISIYEFDKSIRLKVIVDDITIGLSSIVPLGLLINELTSNSLKHAFEKTKQGAISIHLKGAENDYLYYQDSGKWKENSTPGFGLDLIELLTEQLEGSSEHFTSEGQNRYKFRFSKMIK